MILMPPKFVAFDLETTGLNNQKDEIIEIGAVKFTVETKNGKVVPKLLGELETFVKPNMMIPAEASAVNHIYDSDVQDAPAVGDAIKKFTEFCGQSSILLAHNANFDASFLRVAFPAPRRNQHEDRIRQDAPRRLRLPDAHGSVRGPAPPPLQRERLGNGQHHEEHGKVQGHSPVHQQVIFQKKNSNACGHSFVRIFCYKRQKPGGACLKKVCAKKRTAPEGAAFKISSDLEKTYAFSATTQTLT